MKYSEIERDKNSKFKVGSVSQVPDISHPQEVDLSTLFLGPRAENHELLTQLISRALKHIFDYRQSYYPDDPKVITEAIQSSTSYQEASRQIQEAFDELLDFLLKHATPYFSLRYQGHMLWDNTIPAIAAYFAAMLHNPNNVTFQASTSTTPLAMLVGWDMCRMVGFQSNDSIEPWSHLTADGSIANIESLWASRELRSLPFAICDLLKSNKESHKKFLPAVEMCINCCDGREVKLLEAKTWDLLNLTGDEVLDLPLRVSRLCKIDDVFDVWNAVIAFTQNAQGWLHVYQQMVADSIQQPIIITPSTKHYSWPKAAALTGFGVNAINDVYVDADARMDMGRLKARLDHCLEHKIPVLMLVVVCGSTEESAVDNINEVLALREAYRQRGLDFIVHVDAAWGGYMLTSIRKPYSLYNTEQASQYDEIFLNDMGEVPASDYVLEQLKSIRLCDSVTIDPHKWGYVQYPAGAVLYRNGELRRLTTFTSSYIGNSSSIKPDGPNVGIFGLEGSRSGAAAAAVFFSHRCLRPTVDGYGRIISECLFNTRMFYIRLLLLNSEELNFVVVPLVQLPAEKRNTDVKKELAFIKNRIYFKTKKDLQLDSEAWQLFRELGPDQNILDYGFNFRKADGSINSDPVSYNSFNEMIHEKFSMHFDKEQPYNQTPFILTRTTFARHEYGDEFMDRFAERLRLQGKSDGLSCLRSVVMDPYLTQTADGSYFVEIIKLIRKYVSEISEKHFSD